LGVFPPINIAGEKHVNPEFLKQIKIFATKGGPLRIAREAGMREEKVYSTLMDKGPCGLCAKGIELSQK